MTGKLIVIDGTDGSGKATQVKILADRLQAEGHKIFVADFPRYGESSAHFVEQYLNGHYGGLEAVGPKKGSMFYALDRFAASFELQEKLDQGYIILSNRYVTASMGHQGAKITDGNERNEFFHWLHELEYEILGIPRPQVNIILHVPAEISQKLVDKKVTRAYIENGAKRDLHEGNLDHLKAAEQVYLEIADKFDDFTLIECVKDGTIMSREEIAQLVWDEIQKAII